MRVISLGTEIVECLRIGRMIERHGEMFLQRVYTQREIRFCQSRRRTLEHFAARWAAKEAILKCLGPGWHKRIAWTSMEIHTSDEGSLNVELSGLARDRAAHLRIKEIMLSIAHCRAYATAYAMAVANDA